MVDSVADFRGEGEEGEGVVGGWGDGCGVCVSGLAGGWLLHAGLGRRSRVRMAGRGRWDSAGGQCQPS